MAVTSIAAVLAAAAITLDGVRAVLWLAPFVVISVDRYVRRIPIPKIAWFACALCWVGTVSILHPRIAASPSAIALAVVAAAAFGGYQLLTASLRSDPATTSVLYSGLVTLAVMSALMPFVWKPLTAQALLVYFGMGVAGWLSLLCLDKALHTLEPGRAVVYGYGHLIASVVINYAMTGRSPGLGGFVGSVLIGIGTTVAAVAGLRADRPLAAESGGQ
jgi:drug/metabolite transporter (DMT)-like permease